jgi:type IV pilus assembly protein PilF
MRNRRAGRLAAPAFFVALMLTGCGGGSSLDDNAHQRLLQIHTELGVAYLQRNQLDIAQQELEKALAIDSDDVNANNAMALLQSRLKRYDDADKYFRRAVSARPRNPEAHNNYGVFLCEQGRIDVAEEQFKRAVADPLYKTPDLANLNAGLCLMKKPVPQAAAVYFKAALEANPRLAPALMEMAKISFDSGNTLSARGYMQRYFEAAPDSPESLWLAVMIERALGTNKDLQASYALRLTGKYPESPEAKRLKQLRSNGR